jgi:hypothetical protein
MLDIDTRRCHTIYMKKHTPIYYTIRSAVRVTVWGGITFGLLLGLVSHYGDKTPSCPVRIVSASPALWESDTPIDVRECIAPAYMVLNQDGSWQWVGE